jgi:AcrR family transcriptional regulator
MADDLDESTPAPARRPTTGPRSAAKRDRIVEAAMAAFAERGYQGARVEDIATELGIAKGSVFQHFGSKERLFLAAYKRAVQSFPAWLDAPPDVRVQGFFATMRYWLERTERLMREDWIPYRVELMGNHGTDLKIRRMINNFLVSEDPYGTAAFVSFGLERKELRKDIDPDLIGSILDWTMDHFQDALLTEELDPGLFRRHGSQPERTEARIQQFLAVLKSAIGAGARPGASA